MRWVSFCRRIQICSDPDYSISDSTPSTGRGLGFLPTFLNDSPHQAEHVLDPGSPKIDRRSICSTTRTQHRAHNFTSWVSLPLTAIPTTIVGQIETGAPIHYKCRYNFAPSTAKADIMMGNEGLHENHQQVVRKVSMSADIGLPQEHRMSFCSFHITKFAYSEWHWSKPH